MAIEHLLGTLLPLTSVKLGRLVLKAGKPHEDFIDPLYPRPAERELHKTIQINFTETRKFSKSSKLRTYLSDVLCISFQSQNNGSATLSAPCAKTYDLENSAAWFDSACAQEETRTFLEGAIDKERSVYLVVGFRTVENGNLTKSVSWTKAQGVKGEMPGATIALNLAANTAVPGATFGQDVGNSQEVAYDAPGEQVFAVLYRKVKFKWHSAKTVDTMSLGANNRWVSCWDDWRGPSEEVESEEDEVLEANLTDASDLDISDDE